MNSNVESQTSSKKIVMRDVFNALFYFSYISDQLAVVINENLENHVSLVAKKALESLSRADTVNYTRLILREKPGELVLLCSNNKSRREVIEEVVGKVEDTYPKLSGTNVVTAFRDSLEPYQRILPRLLLVAVYVDKLIEVENKRVSIMESRLVGGILKEMAANNPVYEYASDLDEDPAGDERYAEYHLTCRDTSVTKEDIKEDLVLTFKRLYPNLLIA